MILSSRPSVRAEFSEKVTHGQITSFTSIRVRVVVLSKVRRPLTCPNSLPPTAETGNSMSKVQKLFRLDQRRSTMARVESMSFHYTGFTTAHFDRRRLRLTTMRHRARRGPGHKDAKEHDNDERNRHLGNSDVIVVATTRIHH